MGTHSLTVGIEDGDVGSTFSYIAINLPDSRQRRISFEQRFLNHDKRFNEAFEHHCSDGKHYLRTITHLLGADGLSVRLESNTCVAHIAPRLNRDRRHFRHGQHVGQVVSGLRAFFSRFSMDGSVALSENNDYSSWYNNEREDLTCDHVIKNTNSVKGRHRRYVKSLRLDIEKSYLKEFGNQFISFGRTNTHFNPSNASDDGYSDCDVDNDGGSMICLHENLEIESLKHRGRRRRSFASRFIESDRVEKALEDGHRGELLGIRWDKVWKQAAMIPVGRSVSQPGAAPIGSSSSMPSVVSTASSSGAPGGGSYDGPSELRCECLPSDDLSSCSSPIPQNSNQNSESSKLKVLVNPNQESPKFRPPVIEFEYVDEPDSRTSTPGEQYEQSFPLQQAIEEGPEVYDRRMTPNDYDTSHMGKVIDPSQNFNCHLFVCIPDPVPRSDYLQYDSEGASSSQQNPTDDFPFPRRMTNWREVIKATMEIGWTTTGDDQVGRVPLATVFDLLKEARTHGKVEQIFEAAGRDSRDLPIAQDGRASYNDSSNNSDDFFKKIPKVYPHFTVDETFPFDPNLKTKAIDEVIERVLDSVKDLSFEALMWMQTYALWICKSMAVRMGQGLDQGIMKDLNWEYVSALDRMTLAIWLLLRLRRNKHASRVYSRVTMMRGDWDRPEVGLDLNGSHGIVAAAATATTTNTDTVETPLDLYNANATTSSSSSTSPPAPSVPQQPTTSPRSVGAPRKPTHRMDPVIHAYNSRLPPSTKLPKSIDYGIPFRNGSSTKQDTDAAKSSKPENRSLNNNDNNNNNNSSSSSSSSSSINNNNNNNNNNDDDNDYINGSCLQTAVKTRIRTSSAYIATATRDDKSGAIEIDGPEVKKVTFNDEVELVSSEHQKEVDKATIEATPWIRKRFGNFIIEKQAPNTKRVHRATDPHTDPIPQAHMTRGEYLVGLSHLTARAKATT
ncbi:hypothetical protein BGZ65_012865, partial [Modicella reniformis]